MTDTWLDTLALATRTTPVIRAVVIETRGSAPREVGAWMLITATTIENTIGGGAMEQSVIAAARAALAKPQVQRWWRDVLHFHLGPDLNQCCGGAVRVLLERYSNDDALALRTFNSAAISRTFSSGTAPNAASTTHTAATANAFTEKVGTANTPVFLYGAGHVGCAVTRALAPLPFALTWLDGPRDQDTTALPSCENLSEPALLARAAAAPPGAFHLVMTHSHALDEALVATILKADRCAYLGLIGSETKAARFRQRLARTGLPDAQIERLHCPIGLPGLTGKAPALIAASVAADLLLRRQGQTLSRIQTEQAD